VGGTTTLASLDSLTKNDTAGWKRALDAAAAADAVVMVLGIDGSIEGESNDRTSIDLPAVQHAFAAAVAALGKPTVVVLLHGGSIDTTAERDAPGVGAILDAFYPGMKGAEAIASTIFGDNDRLGGKMAFTTYPASYVNDIKMSEMELDVGPGRGYRFFTGTPVYPFGFGLSLTSFSLALASGPPASTLATEAAPSSTLSYTVTVTNTGARAGDTVVQAYFSPRSTPAQPASKLRKQLFDYARVHLAPGAAATVSFNVTSATLRLADRATGDDVSTPGAFDVSFEDGVAAPVKVSVTVTGAEVIARKFPY
jgi:beta-D-xylosidase 4